MPDRQVRDQIGTRALALPAVRLTARTLTRSAYSEFRNDGRSKYSKMQKPTDASVTDLPCACGYLERSARDPRLPVRYDDEYNEFYLDLRLPKGTKLSLVVYHCLMCGGVASDSKRDKVFATPSDQELVRLNALTSKLRTVPDIARSLGPPDRDETVQLPADFTSSKQRTQASRTIRVLTYERLSKTADLQFTVYANGKIDAITTPKYVGPRPFMPNSAAKRRPKESRRR